MLSALGDPILFKAYRVTSFVELFVSAAIHGDEINGVEIIRRVMKLNALKNLRGELVAVPIVNVPGFINLSR